jgi:hypothetical protein
MKISKFFEMTISGNYQSYKFASGVEEDYPSESNDLQPTSEALQDVVVRMVLDDIKKQTEIDSEFAVVLAARSQALLRDKLIREKVVANSIKGGT